MMSSEEPEKPDEPTGDEAPPAAPATGPATDQSAPRVWPRRMILKTGIAAAVTGAAFYVARELMRAPDQAAFIARVAHYRADIASVIGRGLAELGITENTVRGKKVLLKPNLVEPIRTIEHVNTHPAVVAGAVQAFLRLGASSVVVGEGAGHRRDSFTVLESSGIADVLAENRVPFVDLNCGPTLQLANNRGASALTSLAVHAAVGEADLVVSLAKMKTHHWAGVTLSMKNLYGIMPGEIYGWPKNVLHWAGLNEVILDINQAVRPQISIVDGIVGMQGDGPILGEPAHSGVLVMARNSVAADATCCRVMGIDPFKVDYLKRASEVLGPVAEDQIEQRGERIEQVLTRYQLVKEIPALAKLI